ncbi:40S ribosomal protein S23 [Olea europaea subsp. europaea]|uniref:40S ribosomal protein S23 n=1 Tax=Olea europaea subsp. europaea TaxID=158383 RepID=A0A8S0RFM8_OLEEU|nr:40S ribosomal protein S23 [Olea europaea subsp. europaea]
MAAIDYIVSENSDVFLASHGGNMGHAIPGTGLMQAAKRPSLQTKREMLPYFLNSSLSEAEFNRIMLDLHRDSFGKPEFRNSKAGRDMTKYPIPKCMCNSSTKAYSSVQLLKASIFIELRLESFE